MDVHPGCLMLSNKDKVYTFQSVWFWKGELADQLLYNGPIVKENELGFVVGALQRAWPNDHQIATYIVWPTCVGWSWFELNSYEVVQAW